MAKTVLVPIADGSEEIETTCITDTLTRFGARVTVASVGPTLACTMSRGITIVADCAISDCADKDWDLIALPGGMPGAQHLRDSPVLVDLLKKHKAAGKLYGAVCAGTSSPTGSYHIVSTRPLWHPISYPLLTASSLFPRLFV
jgi:4-methyl-5(b-hydroxyethyl)-thiazole monophosphate biosynthesis